MITKFEKKLVVPGSDELLLELWYSRPVILPHTQIFQLLVSHNSEPKTILSIILIILWITNT